MLLVILAGGPVKSVGKVTGGSSRQLIRILDKTLLDRHLEAAQELFERVITVSDYVEISSYCRQYSGCEFVEQNGKSIEASICSAISHIHRRDYITILYSDIYADKEILRSHIEKFIKNYQPIITLTAPIAFHERYTRVSIDYDDYSVRKIGDGDLVFAGILTVEASFLRENLCKKKVGLIDVFKSLSKSGVLLADVWRGSWVDIDTPWDYMLATRIELSKLNSIYISGESRVSDRAELEPPVYVSDGAIIDHYAIVKGPVYNDTGALIGAHSFVRSYTAVYQDAIIGAYSEVKRSIVYNQARVSSHCYITDSVIGFKAVVSPYTVTLNIPYREVSRYIKLTTSYPLEELKIGSIIGAGSRTKPHEAIEPATLYENR